MALYKFVLIDWLKRKRGLANDFAVSINWTDRSAIAQGTAGRSEISCKYLEYELTERREVVGEVSRQQSRLQLHHSHGLLVSSLHLVDVDRHADHTVHGLLYDVVSTQRRLVVLADVLTVNSQCQLQATASKLHPAPYCYRQNVVFSFVLSVSEYNARFQATLHGATTWQM